MNIRRLIEFMQIRLHWIDRACYMLTDEQKKQLEEIADELSEIDNEIQARA